MGVLTVSDDVCIIISRYNHSSSDEGSMRDAIGDADTVVNLIGKYYETKHLCFTRKPDGSINRINCSFEDVSRLWGPPLISPRSHI